MAHSHLQAPIGQTSPQLLAFAGMPLSAPPIDWVAALIPLFEEIDRYSRRAAREEYELLLAEQAAAIEQADKNDQVLTVQQAANLIGIQPQTVYEWIKADKLRAHRIGRAVRLKRGDVLAALQAQTQPDGRRKYARRGTASKKRM
jgi:excisionase family DNA binding protein